MVMKSSDQLQSSTSDKILAIYPPLPSAPTGGTPLPPPARGTPAIMHSTWNTSQALQDLGYPPVQGLDSGGLPGRASSEEPEEDRTQGP